MERYARCGMCGEEVLLEDMTEKDYRQMNKEASRAKRLRAALRKKTRR